MKKLTQVPVAAIAIAIGAAFGFGMSAREIESLQAPVVIGPTDSRTPLDVAQLTNSPLRATGQIPGCSATKITSVYLVSASHCFQRHPNPSLTTFSPARVPGQPNASIGVKRIILGTQGLSKPCIIPTDCASGICQGTCNYFEGGADFAILEVDPATFVSNGSTLTPTWDSVPAAELVIQAAPPPPPNGVAVSAIGYSSDPAVQGFNVIHRNCQLTQRDPFNAGMFLSNCDWVNGASGGGIFRFTAGMLETQLTALVSGNGDGVTFNRAADTYPPYWSPWDPGGVTAVLNADGRVHAYASDRARSNQMMLRAQFTTTGLYPTTFDTWRDVRGGVSVPNPGRASSVLYDSRQFIFMVGSDRRVYANSQVVPSGNLTGWQGFFPGDRMSEGVLDIASDASSRILFQYLLRSNGQLVLKRKIGGHARAWEPWQVITRSGRFNKIAANNTQGFPVTILGGSALSETWATDLAGTNWVAPQNFSQLGQPGGLPSGSCILDFELGRTIDGRLDAFVLLNERCSAATPAIWRRTKTTNISGSAWGDWFRYRSVTDSFSALGVAMGIPNPQLEGATGMGLLPTNAMRGDGLIIISRGNLYASFWGSATPTKAGHRFTVPCDPGRRFFARDTNTVPVASGTTSHRDVTVTRSFRRWPGGTLLDCKFPKSR